MGTTVPPIMSTVPPIINSTVAPVVFTINIDTVYPYVIEPLLTLCYAFMLVRIVRSPNRELHTAYYTFFVVVGIAGISNVVVILPFGLNNKIFKFANRWDYPMCIFEYGSHVYGTAHTFGKFATILTRVTSILFENETFWTKPRLRLTIFFIFAIPACLFSLFLVMFTKFMNTNTWYSIAKGMTTSFYLAYLILTIPMSLWCITRLHRFSAYNKHARQQEINQTLYAISSSICHDLKGAQQCYWMYATINNDTVLSTRIASYYNYCNTIALFSPPVLLLATSAPTRGALIAAIPFLGYKENIRTNIVDVDTNEAKMVTSKSGISVSVF
ncbi:hypothetical protein PRIPAC_89228 [Pristionchus pacificus]|uniref:Uncharacterized protein n=1 Tax=Pristionchus pacificus TaxID=54126 RepID=A0A2A6B910_PRIPA|nr:hypothetical protein PRIPAC_89228 [Pristionchus pacificus]|eukprot:PDM62354.1 hypothetical protein PRIPAC_51796 [Pristionchus pacificus]